MDKKGDTITKSGRGLFLFDLLDKIKTLSRKDQTTNIVKDMYIKAHNNGWLFVIWFVDGQQIGEFFDDKKILETFLHDDFSPCVVPPGDLPFTFDRLLRSEV